MVAAVGAFAEDVFVVVVFEFEGGVHESVGFDPVPTGTAVTEVVSAVLEENADGLFVGDADEFGIFVAAADVGEAADMADDFANWSGRSQATVKAQMPPLLMPQMAWPSG